jgi:phosphoglycerol transferase MdoB-like AlkP superfamily enzyme
MSLLNRIPKLLQWIIIAMFLLLVLMFFYRIFFFTYYSQPGRPITGSAFLLGLRYDARVVAAIGLAMMLLCVIPLLDPFKNRKAKKLWIVILTLVFLIFLLFYVADFYHYDYLQQRLNASVFNFLPDARISFTMMAQTYPLFSISLLIIVLVWLYAWVNNKLLTILAMTKSWVPGKQKKWFFIVAGFLMAVLIFGRLGQYPLRWSDAFALNDDFKSQAALNPFQSFFSSLKFRNSSYDVKKLDENYPLMAGYLGVQDLRKKPYNFTRDYQFTDSIAPKPNIIVVICESFSAHKSSMYGNLLNTTPFFASLCRNGVFFDRCFTPAFGTARGVWATITGIPDVEPAKTASRNPAAVDQHSIINDFKDHNKFYFLGGSTTWANIRGVLTNNIEGLKIVEEDNFDAGTVDVWGISDKDLFLAANKEMAKQGNKPFFTIIQTAGNHRPYTIPSEDLPEFKLEKYPPDTLRKYGFASNEELNAFRYSDFCFKKYIEAASKEKYFGNTIFIFVGDHGLRGDIGPLFPQSFTKQGFGAEHVPLLFYAPQKLEPKRISDVCSQLDILPSAAYLARQSYRNTTLGRNLFDTADKKEHFAFIADPDTRFIGLVSNQFYYGRNLGTGAKEFVSVLNNDPVPVNAQTDSSRKYMEALTEAFYHTSMYLLQNNKKKKTNF